MAWRIYYSDGSVITSEDKAVAALCYKEISEVQVILQQHANGDWYSEYLADYYVWDAREEEIPRWWGVDFGGLMVYLLQPGWKKILLGERLKAEVYDRIMAQVATDTQALRKGEL